MEYWKNNDRLDLLKTFIDSNDIGDIKQFVNYRDWLAHKNPKKEVNRPATPETVYEKMKTILDELDKQS